MLATAWWHQFLTFPPCMAWAQFSLKHAKGLIKAGTFIPSLSDQREPSLRHTATS